MARIVNARINLALIDKTKIFEGKNGAKWIDIDITINDEKNKYDQDCAVSLSQTKEQRAAKEKKVYLGNGKTVWTNDGSSNNSPQASDSPFDQSGDDLPF